jgi:hypothetical protein
MEHLRTEGLDVESTLERALGRASSVLQRAASELGAEAVAVLLASGYQFEVTYFWRGSHGPVPAHFPAKLWQSSGMDFHRHTGGVEAGSSLARDLSEWLLPESRSFLLFPWRIRQRTVMVVFCFSIATPPVDRTPVDVVENLDLIGLATWSVKEIARLRTELKTVTGRLAGRKLVEKAKGLLQLEEGISEERAYEYLRGQSRKRRITLAALAEEVVRKRGGGSRDGTAAT